VCGQKVELRVRSGISGYTTCFLQLLGARSKDVSTPSNYLRLQRLLNTPSRLTCCFSLFALEFSQLTRVGIERSPRCGTQQNWRKPTIQYGPPDAALVTGHCRYPFLGAQDSWQGLGVKAWCRTIHLLVYTRLGSDVTRSQAGTQVVVPYRDEVRRDI